MSDFQGYMELPNISCFKEQNTKLYDTLDYKKRLSEYLPLFNINDDVLLNLINQNKLEQQISSIESKFNLDFFEFSKIKEINERDFL